MTRVDAGAVGLASVILGAGRSKAGDPVSPGAGVTLKRIASERVEAGQELCLVHGDQEGAVTEALNVLTSAFTVGPTAPVSRRTLVLEEITQS